MILHFTDRVVSLRVGDNNCGFNTIACGAEITGLLAMKAGRRTHGARNTTAVGGAVVEVTVPLEPTIAHSIPPERMMSTAPRFESCASMIIGWFARALR
jgi:hypothetical protein